MLQEYVIILEFVSKLLNFSPKKCVTYIKLYSLKFTQLHMHIVAQCGCLKSVSIPDVEGVPRCVVEATREYERKGKRNILVNYWLGSQ